MGFFEKIRSGRLFFGKKEPLIIVRFELEGRQYILEEFDLEFKQDVDAKGRPNSPVYGGLISITFSDIPDEVVNTWMLNPFQRKDGEFRFLTNDRMIMEGAELQIRFENAYCVGYRKTITPLGTGVLTSLFISPVTIKIGREELQIRKD